MAVRARVHYMRGNVHFVQMDPQGCEAENRKALLLAQQTGDAEMEAWALSGLVRAAFVTGHIATTGPLLSRFLEICDECGLEHLRFSQIHMLGMVREQERRFPEAMEAFEASLEQAPRVGAPRQAIIGGAGGAQLLLDCGDPHKAAEFARAAIELSRQVGERRYEPAARALLVMAEETDREQAMKQLREAWDRLDEDERRFSGWWLLYAMLSFATTEQQFEWIERQAKMDLSKSNGGGYLVFEHHAIITYLGFGNTAQAREHAEQLESFLGEALSPLSQLLIRGAVASAERRADGVAAVKEEALRVGHRRLYDALSRLCNTESARSNSPGRAKSEGTASH